MKELAAALPDTAWRRVTWREGTNAPLASRFAAIRDQFTLMYLVILRARLRHAQYLGMHPRRMLAYFALQEVGIPVHASTLQLGPDESILSEVDFSGPVTEAQLRRVERRVRDAQVETFAQPLLPLAELLRAI